MRTFQAGCCPANVLFKALRPNLAVTHITGIRDHRTAKRCAMTHFLFRARVQIGPLRANQKRKNSGFS